MGLLSGLAFALFYTVAGIPIARWADHGSRRTIISLGLAVWSAMTVLSGLSRTVGHLALARIGVGIGEAAGSPPAHSLLSDYFGPRHRATALAIYSTGIYAGAMLAYLAGGYLLEWFDWRTAFLLVGVPGLPLAVVVRLTVRELPRGLADGGRPAPAVEPFGVVLRHLRTRRSFVLMAAAAACQSVVGYALLAWAPAFLGRVHGLGPAEIGLWLGLVVGIGGSAGTFLGGALGDRLGRRDPRRYVQLCGTVSLAGVPFVLAFLLAADWALAAIWLVPAYVLTNMYLGPVLALTQALVPPQMRATASAILLFVFNLVGLGGGPFLVGALSDALAGSVGPGAIRYALAAVALMGVPAGLCFLSAGRTLREDLR